MRKVDWQEFEKSLTRFQNARLYIKSVVKEDFGQGEYEENVLLQTKFVISKVTSVISYFEGRLNIGGTNMDEDFQLSIPIETKATYTDWGGILTVDYYNGKYPYSVNTKVYFSQNSL